MSTAQNKQLLQHLYAELAKGNTRPWIESMADGVRWTVSGSTAWSRTYEGKQAVLGELLRPLSEQFAQPYKTIADRFIAEGDRVVVEARGETVTKAGLAYNNHYCFIYRLAGGRIEEIVEYCDTALIESALGAPPQRLRPAPDRI